MTNHNHHSPEPPRWATRLLQHYLQPERAEEIEGDLTEAFLDEVEFQQLWHARLNYTIRVLKFISPFANEHPREYYPKANLKDMFLNYLKLSSRYLFKHKGFTLMNILGLAIGLATCLVIFFYVQFELNYDAFHQNADRIFRVSTRLYSGESEDELAPAFNGLALVLKEQFPEVAQVTRFVPMSADIRNRTGEVFNENYFYKADPEVFDIFTYPFVAGNPKEALQNPHSLVLTQKMAAKYFPEMEPQNVLGTTLDLNKQSYQITGIIEDPPQNADMLVDALISWKFDPQDVEQWLDLGSYTFVLLHNQKDVNILNQKLPQLDKQVNDRIQAGFGIDNLKVNHALVPLTSLHYSADWMGDTEQKGNRSYIYIFSCIAVFILIIACINYVNFAVAQASGRSVEAGVRKAAGARQNQLWLQFMSESFLVTSVALLLAVGLVSLAGKHLTELIGPSIASNFFLERENIILLGMILLVVSIFSGSYPAFVLAMVNPVNALKGKNLLSQNKGRLRKVLLMVQLTLAIGMIISTLVVRSQIRYMSQKNLGYDQKVLSLSVPDDTLAIQKLPVLKNNLLKQPGVTGVSLGFRPEFLALISAIRVENEGESREISAFGINADENYLTVLDIPLLAGADFNPEKQVQQLLVNESFVKKVGWSNPVGQKIYFSEEEVGEVVGVIHDFHYTSLHEKIDPLMITYDVEHPVNILIKTAPDQLDNIEATWHQTLSDFQFNYEFLDQSFDQKYKTELNMMTLFNCFSGLSIFIACMGLLGLVAFTVQLKTKEIGIRKVLGANKLNIVYMVSREFVLMLVLSAVVALPLAYFAMDYWLQNFAYRTSVSVGIMLGAVILMGVLVLLTLSFHALKAAYANPIHSLRNE